MHCVSPYFNAPAMAAALVITMVSCADRPARAEVGLSQAVHTAVQRHVQTQQQREELQKSLGAVGDRVREEVRRWFGPSPGDR